MTNDERDASPTTAADAPMLTLDVRGRRCPLPIIELARRINDVDTGAVIAVVSDDPAARVDVPAWCRMRDHDYLGERSSDASAAVTYLVRRQS